MAQAETNSPIPPSNEVVFVLHYRRELVPSQLAFRTIVSVENVTHGRMNRFKTLDLAFDHIRTSLTLSPGATA